MRRLLLIFLLATLAQLARAQSFSAPVSYFGGTTCYGLGAADLNNDGYADAVTAIYGTNSVGVLLSNKNGTLAPLVSYRANGETTGYNALRLVVGDVNGDSYPDILTLDARVRAVDVLLNNKNGTFAPYVVYPTSGTYDSPISGLLADVTGDGYPDLLTANSNTTYPAMQRTVSVLRNNKNGTFAAPVLYPTGSTEASTALAVLDVNNDTYPDLLTSYPTAGQLVVLRNDGSGAFTPAGTFAAGVASSALLRTADFNRDGYQDLVVVGSALNLAVLLNNRSGAFATPASYTVGANNGEPLTAVAVADINGDAYPDVVVGLSGTAGTSANKVGVLLNSRSGTLGPVVRFGGSYDVNFVETADVNRDGKPDILSLSLGTFSVDVRLNQTVFMAARSSLAGAQAGIFPNPASSPATLAVTNLPAEVRQLRATLLAATGQAVRHLTLPVVQGTAQAPLPTAGLAAGLYELLLTGYTAQETVLNALPPQRLVIP